MSDSVAHRLKAALELVERLKQRQGGRIYVALLLLFAALALVRLQPRSVSLPLETVIDGPKPARAAGLLVFLHGHGNSVARSAALVKRLRAAGLPANISIVLLQGPYPTPFGYGWGDDASEQAASRARVRARLADLIGENGPPPAQVVLVGFSQGAGIAGDIAAEEPRIGALASFSPCAFWLRNDLPRRQHLRVLLAHGRRDGVCPVNESRSLAGVLKQAGVPVQYLEFDGEHEIPAQVVDALVTFATAH